MRQALHIDVFVFLIKLIHAAYDHGNITIFQIWSVNCLIFLVHTPDVEEMIHPELMIVRRQEYEIG